MATVVTGLARDGLNGLLAGDRPGGDLRYPVAAKERGGFGAWSRSAGMPGRLPTTAATGQRACLVQ